MQRYQLDDIKLPPAQRRNYKHAIDGVYRIWKEEGVTKLFNGELNFLEFLPK